MANIKAMGSLSNKLLNFISTTLVHDSNYDIALILLKNYGKLKKMSIAEVADLCYVSQASISRFCRFIGFDNFKEFKQSLEQDFSIANDYSRQFYAMLCSDEKMAIATYRDEMIGNIYSTLSPENMEIVPDIIKAIHDSKQVACFSHHFLWDICRFFQSKMMVMGKYVEQFLDYNAQLECARSLTPDSLAIICSVGGSYITRYTDIWDAIEASGCTILVITQNLSSPYLNSARFVLRCGESNRDDIGKYAAMMATDILVINYMKRYDKRIG